MRYSHICYLLIFAIDAIINVEKVRTTINNTIQSTIISISF